MADLPPELQAKLALLRDRYKSPDSGPEIDRIENDFHKLIDAKGVLDQPIFKEFVALAERKLNEASALLMNDEKYLNDDGIRLSRSRDLYRLMLDTFGIRTKDEAYKALEQVVDYKLGN